MSYKYSQKGKNMPEMNIEEYYCLYGKLMLQLEILQNKIQECKRAIIAEAKEKTPKED